MIQIRNVSWIFEKNQKTADLVRRFHNCHSFFEKMMINYQGVNNGCAGIDKQFQFSKEWSQWHFFKNFQKF